MASLSPTKSSAFGPGRWCRLHVGAMCHQSLSLGSSLMKYWSWRGFQ